MAAKVVIVIARIRLIPARIKRSSLEGNEPNSPATFAILQLLLVKADRLGGADSLLPDQIICRKLSIDSRLRVFDLFQMTTVGFGFA
jgi:hypothetical protein